MGNAFLWSITPFLLMPVFLVLACLATFLLERSSNTGLMKVYGVFVNIFMALAYVSGGIGVLLCYFLFGGSPLFGGDYYAPYFN